MSKWTKSLTLQLKMAGTKWKTDVDGECISFYGIFDAENRLETDDTGMQVLIAGSAVTLKSEIAEKFVFNQQLIDEKDTVWFVREVMKMEDGALSKCNITEKPNDS